MADDLKLRVSFTESALSVGPSGGLAIRVRGRLPLGRKVASSGMYAVPTALDLVLELPPGRSQSVQHVPACPCPEIRAARDPAVPVAPDPCRWRLDLVGVPVALVAEAFEAAHWSCRIRSSFSSISTVLCQPRWSRAVW